MMKIKKGDMVKVIAGKDKDKEEPEQKQNQETQESELQKEHILQHEEFNTKPEEIVEELSKGSSYNPNLVVLTFSCFTV